MSGLRVHLLTVLVCIPLALEAAEGELLLRNEKLAATVVGIDAELKCEFRSGQRALHATHADLIRFGVWRPASRGPLVLLTDGSLLRVDLTDMEREQIKVGDATGLGRVLWNETTIALQQVRAVCFDLPAEELTRDTFLDRLAASQPRDLVWLAGGETLSGVLLGWKAEADKEGETVAAPAIQLKPPGAKAAVSLPLSKVRALTLGTAGNASPPAGKRLAIGFRDGSLVYATSVREANGNLLLQLACGATIGLPLKNTDEPPVTCWEQIDFVQPLGGSAVYLSDLKPVSVKSVPFLTIEWPHRADRSVLGGWLRIPDKKAAPKGLGQQAAGRLVYDVPARSERFEAELAIDARAERRGSVQFRVLLEDEQGEWSEAARSETIRGAETPVPISVPLKSAQRVALLVDFADRGDECDYANWLNARFILSP